MLLKAHVLYVTATLSILVTHLPCSLAENNTIPAQQELQYVHRYPSHYNQHHLRHGPFYKQITSSTSKLPSLHALHHRHVCDQLNFSTPVNGSWYQDSAGRFFFELQKCSLRRLNAKQAADCLAGRHIYFIGDSVTRYQYLALAHFLAAGHYQHPTDDDEHTLSVTNGKMWDGWGHFYKGVPKLIMHQASPGMHTSLRCHDCNKQRQKEHWVLQLRREEGNSSNSSSSNSSSASPEGTAAHSEGAGTPGGGSVNPSKHNSHSEPTATAAVRLTFDYVGDMPSFTKAGKERLTRALGHLEAPEMVIINMGIFYPEAKVSNNSSLTRQPVETFADIFQHGQDLAGRAGNMTHLVFKTTTTKLWDDPDRNMAVSQLAMQRFGMSVYDVRAIARAAEQQELLLTWNNHTVHFLQVVYEAMNDLLLNILCKPEGS